MATNPGKFMEKTVEMSAGVAGRKQKEVGKKPGWHLAQEDDGRFVLTIMREHADDAGKAKTAVLRVAGQLKSAIMLNKRFMRQQGTGRVVVLWARNDDVVEGIRGTTKVATVAITFMFARPLPDNALKRNVD